MKSCLFSIACCLLSMYVFAQDNNTGKPKTYLGILRVTEKYTIDSNWKSADEAIIGEHFQRLVKKKEEGVVVFAGRTQLEMNDPDLMGLVIFHAKDDKEALQFMLDDPAVKNNIMVTKVLPYDIAISKCDDK